VRELGALSALVCNAAINRRKSSLAARREVWDQVLDVNLRSTMHAVRTALPYLAQSTVRRGRAHMSRSTKHGRVWPSLVSSSLIAACCRSRQAPLW
jgi:NAD(P)-dependent dehydrogenase (short-subunit alcohol dehydrogenase family)